MARSLLTPRLQSPQCGRLKLPPDRSSRSEAGLQLCDRTVQCGPEAVAVGEGSA